jgi:hypothetical protein
MDSDLGAFFEAFTIADDDPSPVRVAAVVAASDDDHDDEAEAA